MLIPKKKHKLFQIDELLTGSIPKNGNKKNFPKNNFFVDRQVAFG